MWPNKVRSSSIAASRNWSLSFSGIGLFVATIGFAIGLDAEWFRAVAAVLLICFGVVMLSGWLQRRFSGATASLGSLGDQWLRRIRVEGLSGQLIVGLLLGLVWAPCVGPTLGAAATLASQGKNLAQVALVMSIFGIGAVCPWSLSAPYRAGFSLPAKAICFASACMANIFWVG